MRRLLGLGDANTVDDWRRKFGYAAEHREKSGTHRGVWLYAPQWLALYFSATNNSPRPDGSISHRDRLSKARADLEEIRVQQLRGQLVTADDAVRAFEWCLEVVRTAHRRLCDRCRGHVCEVMDHAKESAPGSERSNLVAASKEVYCKVQTKRRIAAAKTAARA